MIIFSFLEGYFLIVGSWNLKKRVILVSFLLMESLKCFFFLYLLSEEWGRGMQLGRDEWGEEEIPGGGQLPEGQAWN